MFSIVSGLCLRFLNFSCYLFNNIKNINMLEPIKHALDFQRIILASVSPRRSEILHTAGLNFEIMPSLFEEDLDPRKFPTHGDYAVETAYRKVLDVSDRLSKDPTPPDIIVGADTVVSLDGKIFGKPEDSKMAFKFLEQLSGRLHTVYTGVVIKTREATIKFYESTNVQMAYLPEEVIRGYIRTKEPLDKAGAYGIQGYGGSLIERIEGDYYNVLGLPLYSFCKHLRWLYDDKVKRMELTKTIGPLAATDVLSEAKEIRAKELAANLKMRAKSKDREKAVKSPRPT